jgi:hypothetical protein
MKIKNFCVLGALFFCLLGYTVRSFAGDKMEKEYLVIINGIPMQRSSAENFFRYLGADGSCDVGVFDVKTHEPVRLVTEGMDVTVQNNLMEEIARLYRGFLNKKQEDYSVIMNKKLQACVASSKQFEGKTIELCINNESKVIISLIWY